MALNAAELQITITADASQAQAELNGVEGMISGVLVGHQVANFGEQIMDFVGGFVTVGAEFEEQMVMVDQIIGGTISHLEELKQKAIDADINTLFNALEVTQGMEMLARGGFDALKIIGTPGKNDGLIDALLFFASATKTEMSSAGRAFAAAMRIFEGSGMTGIEMADLLTAAILRSGRTADQFMTAFQYVGSISQQFGTAPDDIAMIISLMLSLGVRSLSTGTSLRSFYSAIASGRGNIEAMGISLYTANDAGQEVLRTLPDIIQQFHKLSQTMSPGDFYTLLEDTFGKPAASGLMTLFTTGAENMDRFTESMNNVSDAESIMEARMSTLKGSLEKLSATWLGLKKVMGDSVSEWIKPVVDELVVLVDTLQNAPPIVHQILAVLLTFAGVLTLITGKMIIFRALGGNRMMARVFAEMGTSINTLLGPLRLLFLPLTLVTRGIWALALPLRIVLGPLNGLFRPLMFLLKLLPMTRLAFLAAGLGIAAIKTNFGGITDWIKGLGDKWKDFKERFREGLAFNKESHQLSRGLATTTEVLRTGWKNIALNAAAALRDMGMPNFVDDLKSLFPHIDKVGRGFDIITSRLQRLSNVIKTEGIGEGLRQLFTGDIGADMLSGLGDIVAGVAGTIGEIIQEIDTGDPQLDRALHNFGASFQGIGKTIEAILDGEWSRAWENFKKSVRQAVRGGFWLSKVLIRVAGWSFSAAVDIWDELKGWIYGATGGSTQYGPGTGALNPGRENIPIDVVAIQIKSWTIDAWNGSLTQSLWGEIVDILIGEPFDFEQMMSSRELGNDIGGKLGEWTAKALKFGLEKAYDLVLGMFGIQTGANGALASAGRKASRATTFSFGDLLGAFVDGFFEGFETEGEKVFASWRTKVQMWWYNTIESFYNIFSVDGGRPQREGAGGIAGGYAGERDFSFMSIIKGLLKLDDWAFESLGLPAWGEQFRQWLRGQLNIIKDEILSNPTAAAVTRLLDGDFTGAFKMLTGSDKPPVPNTNNEEPWGFFDNRWWNGDPSEWQEYQIGLYMERQAQLKKEREDFVRNNPPPPGVPGGLPYIPPIDPIQGPEQPGVPLRFLDPITSGNTLAIAGDRLRTFAVSTAPLALASLAPNMQRIGTLALQRMTAAVTTGMGLANRAAYAGAQLISTNARVPDLWNHGFNVGYNLGAGMAAGMNAALALVRAARNSLNNVATSQPPPPAPGIGPVPAAAGVTPRQGGTISQTNYINMDLAGVQELVAAGAWVSNLDSRRQVVLGEL